MSIVHDVLYNYFSKEKTVTIILIVLTFVINLIQTGGISYIISSIIDGIEHNKYDLVSKYYKYFIALSLLFVVLSSISKYLQTTLLTRLVQWMRREFFEYVLRSNSDEYSQENVMKYNSPINRISYASYMWTSNVLNNMLPGICFFIIILLFFLYSNFTLGVVFIACNVVLYGYALYHWPSMLDKKNKYERSANANEEYVVDMFNNLDKIVYRGTVEDEIVDYNNRAEDCIQIGETYYKNINKHTFIMMALLYVSVFVYVGLLIGLRKRNVMNIKVIITCFTVILLYREHAYNAIQMIPDMLDFQGRNEFILRKFEDLKHPYGKNNIKAYEDRTLTFDTIQFENVSFQYKKGALPVVTDLNMTLDTRDKVIGLTGLSGRGKSTIVKMLLRMYSPTSGRILIDGVDIQDIDPVYIRKNITYINQNSKLFDRRVIENIMYGCVDPETCDEHFKEIMQRPTISELYKNVDFSGSSGSLGENLSGGQRQVVNLISGLVNPAKIMILDEPTNALDSGLKQDVLQLIRDYGKYKKAVIIITHDRDVYPLFDESIAL